MAYNLAGNGNVNGSSSGRRMTPPSGNGSASARRHLRRIQQRQQTQPPPTKLGDAIGANCRASGATETCPAARRSRRARADGGTRSRARCGVVVGRRRSLSPTGCEGYRSTTDAGRTSPGGRDALKLANGGVVVRAHHLGGSRRSPRRLINPSLADRSSKATTSCSGRPGSVAYGRRLCVGVPPLSRHTLGRRHCPTPALRACAPRPP
jgi:hypothetical protein